MLRKNPYLVSVDSEDDGKGNPYLFPFVHEEGSWINENRETAIENLIVLAEKQRENKRPLEVWATNLEYDLVNLFGVGRLRELELTFNKSALVSAKWSARNMYFRDTLRHIPVSVKELGEMVGLQKLERGKHASKKYALVDATITYRSAKFLRGIYTEFGIEPKMTLAACAYAIWKDKYWKQDVIFPPQEIVDFAKLCYFGGRTEPFGIGEFLDINVIDASSMFPWAMIQGDFPIPWGAFRRAKRNAEIKPSGIYKASIKSNIILPSLPVRTEKGLIYPNGNFDGYFVGEELIYAKEIGIDIKIIEGYEFAETCRPFDKYVTDFFELKNKSRGAQRMVYKLLLNALYGKFGQGGERIKAIPVEEFIQLQYPPEDFRQWYGICIFREIEQPPPWGNNVWSAIVTARARIRLHREAMRIIKKGGKILYCDTDSLCFIGKNSKYPEKAKRPGDFENRGTYRRILIKGKKEYGLEKTPGEWEVHIKGVPGSERLRYLTEGRARYAKPVKIRESSRIKVAPNVWKTVEKRRRVNHKDRKKLPGGFLAPIVLH